ncbi:MAG: D-alanine--D-alanine ligase [Clostridia bacterium]|nr:D-alanine--D-alanine ligase [Clostridia bacterium]
MKEKIALIFGGEGAERSISEISAENLCRMIDGTVYDVMPIGISPSGDWYFYRGARENMSGGRWLTDTTNLHPTFPVKIGGRSGFLADGKAIPVACAIPCLHGDFGEDGTVQGALRAAHISYVGQDVYASAMTSDKSYTKLVAEHLGIPTAKWTVLSEPDARFALEEAKTKIFFPMFIKPARLGSSIGAHPVSNSDSFIEAYNDAYSLGGRVLVEELIPIKYELECAMLNMGGETRIAPYGKITSGGAFYDYGAKYCGKGSVGVSADGDLEKEIASVAKDYAARLVDFIGIRDLGRIDFFVTDRGQVYFNEINVLPGMTESSLYPRLTEQMGLKTGEFINILIEAARDRHI